MIKPGRQLLGLAAFCALFIGAGEALSRSDSPPTMSAPDLKLKVPVVDPERGKALFVERYCVVCHSVNGVGGVAAPAFDAPETNREVDILDFAARMWRGSYAMVELQATEFAYQIELEGEEIGDLAAFAYDLETQKTFSKDDVPPEIAQWILEFSISVEGGLFDDD